MNLKKFQKDFLNVKISNKEGQFNHITEQSEYVKIDGDIVDE